jgi:hypothetical protein
MLTGYKSNTNYSKPTRHQGSPNSSAISRLLCAAVVNKEFRELLLTDPGLALSQGFQGESFPLDYQERKLILSIQADNLRYLALQITSSQEGGHKELIQEYIPEKQPTLVPGP